MMSSDALRYAHRRERRVANSRPKMDIDSSARVLHLLYACLLMLHVVVVHVFSIFHEIACEVEKGNTRAPYI